MAIVCHAIYWQGGLRAAAPNKQKSSIPQMKKNKEYGKENEKRKGVKKEEQI